MEAQVNEANTFPAELYAQSFFARWPTDNRFLKTRYVRTDPVSTLDSSCVTFVMEKYKAGNVYMIQDACLYMRVRILTSKNALPAKAAKVAPVNNILHSMWQSCRLTINDVTLTTNTLDYQYKSYIATTLSYPLQAKASHLQSQGWHPDTAGCFDDISTNNTGFMERNKLFRVGGKIANDYRADGAEFFGRVYHDLVSCESGLPPGTKIKLELERAPDQFVLMSDSTDTENYKIELKKNYALCAVGRTVKLCTQ